MTDWSRYSRETHDTALEHEKTFWREVVPTEQFRSTMEANWRGTAEHFEVLLSSYLDRPARRVVQIGSAVRDAVHFMSPSLERIAVDPLMDFYHTEFALPSNGVVERMGMGEELPVESGSCDGALCMNVLDHTWRPREVVDEFRRVLRSGGLLFLGVDTYPPELAHGAVDDIHLWRFTADDVRDMVSGATFHIREELRTPSSMPTEGSEWFWLVATAT